MKSKMIMANAAARYFYLMVESFDYHRRRHQKWTFSMYGLFQTNEVAAKFICCKDPENNDIVE